MGAQTKKGKAATLPEILTGADLEDFVAARFQTAGYFVEKNLVKQDVEQILELDSVVTCYTESLPDSTIVEVKSGEWGFSDLFKQLGVMTYVSIPKGVFATTVLPRRQRNVKFAQQEAGSFGIDLIFVDDPKKAQEIFSEHGYAPVADELAFNVWRFSYWVERRIIADVRDFIKGNATSIAAKEAIEYYKLLNNVVFFVNGVQKRIHLLYSAYRKHPKLTLGACAELDGKGYDPENADPNSPRIKEAIYEGKHPLLQACMYFEHRARLSVLKAAVDYVCLRKKGMLVQMKGKSDVETMLSSMLPASFKDALKRLEAFPYFTELPHFWQTFLWNWGGFLLLDRIDQEFDYLSAQTGIPKECIPEALELYNEFFGGGWFQDVRGTHFRILKMVPLCFRGIGAFHRIRRNGYKEYSDFGYNDYTGKDLSNWHNATYVVLS